MNEQPVQPKRRRFFRFTLRTALLALIAASVLLGWKANKARRQRKAVAVVRSLGGAVLYEYQLAAGGLIDDEPPGPAWLRNQVGIDFLSNVGGINLSRTQVSDVAPLAGLTSLRALALDNTQVSDLAPLAGLTTSLRALDLNRTQISDLTPLAEMTSLWTLTLDGTQFREESLQQLQQALPNCRIIRN